MWYFRLQTWTVVAIPAFGTCISLGQNNCPGEDPKFLPTSQHVGADLSIDPGPVHEFTLNKTHPVASLDYGLERAGVPFFDVSEIEQPVQVEVKYAEQYNALAFPLADGPYSFSVGLSNTFRVETYNVTSAECFKAQLVQGGQRWQSIRLISGPSITFQQVGFGATVDTTRIDKYPGKFRCSDEKLNAIWNLGAVAASTACVENGSQPAIWDIDSTNGAYINSLRPSQSLSGAFFENYTLEFDSKIDRGGVWWTVASTLGVSGGLHLQLVGDLPADSTFVNTNKTLFQPNTINMAWGYDFVNQTTLDSYFLDTFEVPFNVSEKSWHRIKTVLSPDGFVSVSVDGHSVFNVPMSKYYTGGGWTLFKGTFGFGAWQDHGAHVRNVTVKSFNGTTLYTNPMTLPATLGEYGSGPNLESVCLDGPKRDRLVWLGDFYHTSRIIGVSTSRQDLARGTFDFLVKSQLDSGEFNISPAMGYDPAVTMPWAPQGAFGLTDYQALGISSFYSYIQHSNDLDFLQSTWTNWKKQLDFVVGKINETGDGLWYPPSAFLGPNTGGSAVSCAALQALRELSDLAEVVGDKVTQGRATDAGDSLQRAVRAHLWNEEKGFFSVSPDNKNAQSVAATAFCITSGASPKNQTATSISALKQLALGPGYKDSSDADASNPETVISPNTNGFLLDALFKSGASDLGLDLIRSLWGAMVSNRHTSSGASWEYVNQQGDPGLSLFTSLAHPWGGAATYALTEWVAGIQRAKGVKGFGYANWIVNPQAGVDGGLTDASGQVQTPRGILAVDWKVEAGYLYMEIQAPEETHGTFKYKGVEKPLTGKQRYSVKVEVDGM